jgi:hypothetical protein
MRNFGIVFVVAVVMAFGFAMLRHYHVLSPDSPRCLVEKSQIAMPVLWQDARNAGS